MADKQTQPSAVEALPTPTTYRLEDRGFGLAMHVVESGEGEWIRARDHAAVHAAMCRRIDALAASQEAPKAGDWPEEMTPEQIAAGERYLTERTLRKVSPLPALFNWHEFWREITAPIAAPTPPASQSDAAPAGDAVRLDMGTIRDLRTMLRSFNPEYAYTWFKIVGTPPRPKGCSTRTVKEILAALDAAFMDAAATHEISEFSDDEAMRGVLCIPHSESQNYGKVNVEVAGGVMKEVRAVDVVERAAPTPPASQGDAAPAGDAVRIDYQCQHDKPRRSHAIKAHTAGDFGYTDVEVIVGELLHYDHGPNLPEAIARLALRIARVHNLPAPSLAALAAAPAPAVEREACQECKGYEAQGVFCAACGTDWSEQGRVCKTCKNTPRTDSDFCTPCEDAGMTEVSPPAEAREPAADGNGGAVEWRVLQIGNVGAAFDPPKTRRAFTYDWQPGNVDASRLGRAADAAASASAGDSIDRGLALLMTLQAEGFGVFQIDAARTKEST